ncbi:MAG: DEAD/DEAH box helicase family protein [Lachnospiraceae bacterium]|nr:DEAD/DEAH box helicase family protein [Lachnospiraceae bacterium]
MDLLQHNRIAYESVVEHLQHSDRTCVIHPTGTGKSYIALQLIEDNPDARILYITSVATNLLEL